MEGTIHIKNKQEQEYWIEGALVDKVTTSAYNFNRYGREAFGHYKSGEVEEIPCVVVVEVLGTYMMQPMPIPTTEEETIEEYTPEEHQRVPILEYKKNELVNILNDCNGNRKKAAEVLGVSERTLYRRMKQIGLI